MSQLKVRRKMVEDAIPLASESIKWYIEWLEAQYAEKDKEITDLKRQLAIAKGQNAKLA